MKRLKWTERKFQFGHAPGLMPVMTERLLGTTARMNEITAGLSDEQLSRKNGEAWSIKEHIGHLSDLEDLHEGRVNDFLERKTVLRAADMKNELTYTAGHNARKIDELIEEFGKKRQKLVARFLKLDDQVQEFVSLHPRLQAAVKPVDIAWFTAEHDDHHLADIRTIRKLMGA